MQKQEVMLKISMGSCSKQGVKCKKAAGTVPCSCGTAR